MEMSVDEVANYSKLSIEDLFRALMIVEELANINPYDLPMRGEALSNVAREYLSELNLYRFD